MIWKVNKELFIGTPFTIYTKFLIYFYNEFVIIVSQMLGLTSTPNDLKAP